MDHAFTFLAYSICAFLAALEVIVLWQIITGKINISLLIADDWGDASLSRFQFLLFTFVVGASLLYLTMRAEAFPELNNGVLILLGISGASYALGKGLDKQDPPPPPPDGKAAKPAKNDAEG